MDDNVLDVKIRGPIVWSKFPENEHYSFQNIADAIGLNSYDFLRIPSTFNNILRESVCEALVNSKIAYSQGRDSNYLAMCEDPA